MNKKRLLYPEELGWQGEELELINFVKSNFYRLGKDNFNVSVWYTIQSYIQKGNGISDKDRKKLIDGLNFIASVIINKTEKTRPYKRTGYLEYLTEWYKDNKHRLDNKIFFLTFMGEPQYPDKLYPKIEKHINLIDEDKDKWLLKTLISLRKHTESKAKEKEN